VLRLRIAYKQLPFLLQPAGLLYGLLYVLLYGLLYVLLYGLLYVLLYGLLYGLLYVLLYRYGQNNAGGRPRMDSVIRRAHGKQCKGDAVNAIRRNEGNWRRISLNCGQPGRLVESKSLQFRRGRGIAPRIEAKRYTPGKQPKILR
jgi:hypothetical protein